MPDEWVINGDITRGREMLPVAGLRISARDVDEGHEIGDEVPTDADGRFRIRYVASDFPAHTPTAVFLQARDDGGDVVAQSRRLGSRRAERQVHLQLPDARPTVVVDGAILDREMLEALDEEGFLRLARAAFTDDGDDDAARTLRQLSPRLDPDNLRRRDSLTAAVEMFSAIIAWKRWNDVVQRRFVRLLVEAAPAPDALHVCGPFNIKYRTDAPAPAGAGGDIKLPGTNNVLHTIVPSPATPDYIQRLCFWLDWALTKYTTPPFSLKNPADLGNIDVVVSHWITAYFYGSDTIYIFDELTPDALAMKAAHELLHVAHGRCYNNDSDPKEWRNAIRESGAVLAEDCLFDKVNRYIIEASLDGGALAHSWAGLSEGVGYKASLLLKYMAEQHSPNVGAANEPMIGIETYRTLLEKCATNGYSTETVANAIRALPWYQTFCRFKYLDGAELDETCAETLLGNFWLALYLKDLRIANADRRFDFMEKLDNAIWDSDNGTDAANPKILGQIGYWRATDVLAPGEPVSDVLAIEFPFSAFYYKIDVAGEIDTLRIDTTWAGDARALVQALLIDEDGNVRDILRSDKAAWSRTIANSRDGTKLDHIVVVVAATDSPGTFVIDVTETNDAPDVMVTKWHHIAGTSYEIDSKDWAWTWVSPDIWVDNNNDGLADGLVTFDINNKLKIRLRNQGRAPAAGVEVEFWYQDASGGLSDAAWKPVENTAGIVQKITGLNIPAGAETTGVVDWAPAPSGTSHHFCIRAVVTSPGDPNTDNKRVLSNFGNVRAGLRAFDAPMVRHDPGFRPPGFRFDAIPRAGRRWRVNKHDLAIARHRDGPRPGEPVVDLVRIEPVPADLPAPHRRRNESAPDPHGDYPTDPRALPPGLAGVPLVTLVQRRGPDVIGGFTWAIRE